MGHVMNLSSSKFLSLLVTRWSPYCVISIETTCRRWYRANIDLTDDDVSLKCAPTLYRQNNALVSWFWIFFSAQERLYYLACPTPSKDCLGTLWDSTVHQTSPTCSKLSHSCQNHHRCSSQLFLNFPDVWSLPRSSEVLKLLEERQSNRYDRRSKSGRSL